VMIWSLIGSAFLLDSWGVENQSWGTKEMVWCEHEWSEVERVMRTLHLKDLSDWKGGNGPKGSWAEFVDLELVERSSILSSLEITETDRDVPFSTLRKFNPKRLNFNYHYLLRIRSWAWVNLEWHYCEISTRANDIVSIWRLPRINTQV
jgi:hypothetical protein